MLGLRILSFHIILLIEIYNQIRELKKKKNVLKKKLIKSHPILILNFKILLFFFELL